MKPHSSLKENVERVWSTIGFVAAGDGLISAWLRKRSVNICWADLS
jgi:hypothetical protein